LFERQMERSKTERKSERAHFFFEREQKKYPGAEVVHIEDQPLGDRVKMRARRFVHVAFAAYFVAFSICGITPHHCIVPSFWY